MVLIRLYVVSMRQVRKLCLRSIVTSLCDQTLSVGLHDGEDKIDLRQVTSTYQKHVPVDSYLIMRWPWMHDGLTE